MKKWFWLLLLPLCSMAQMAEPTAWIRINQLGYTPGGMKVAVWCGKGSEKTVTNFSLIDDETKKRVYTGSAGNDFGRYGPFSQTFRLNFSSFQKPGRYYLQTADARSPVFEIGNDVYKGSADFCLRYMRQQRTGFNPYLKDSCHTHDGYVLYGEKAGIKDSTHLDVVGGWHDASDYLQYSATSANATWHLLAAYRDFPQVFTDEKKANGLDGKNGMADVLDEAKWGLDWLLKMHPREDWLFNQIGDDRDHINMRMPAQDTQYGKGMERPVYFVSGEPQQRGKFMNATTGTASTAGKFASAFALGAEVFYSIGKNDIYYDQLTGKALTAFQFAISKPGFTQTASVKSPYIYAEENWTDDMELAYVQLKKSYNNILEKEMTKSTFNGKPYRIPDSYTEEAYQYAKKEQVTPWIGADTAKHYQWYPFINLGHYELAKQLKGKERDTVTGYYKKGIELVWNKARNNAFYRGIPFIWCSNNLTTSFAIQCYWYQQLTGDKTYEELMQANIDWLFGCNPWGTSMVYGLPDWGDTPVDPHSAFTHIKKYPIDGGLVDGPVYTSIYKGLIGIKLFEPDEYAAFQSDLAVYHDDYGDYSTNEPTMDGTASLIYLLAAKEEGSAATEERRTAQHIDDRFLYSHGAIIRGDTTQKRIALVFTGHEFAEGGSFIQETLDEEHIKASFFLTGDFYRKRSFRKLIQKLKREGHYLGAHSDKHLLYCDWNKRDSLLVNKEKFWFDLADNFTAMARLGIKVKKAKYFLPPYEWYNDSISAWARELQLQVVNYTPGTLSHADYTNSSDKNYRGSERIFKSVTTYEETRPAGLNGFLLLFHVGAGPRRLDKFYPKLPELIRLLKAKGYQFQRVDELLHTD